ncbi:uncharacterized protein LOC119066087 [Bradysia coprophila]|uniref:uncharacterized protein LOC119066087 n=1 Tax=Bradysia coprophila TaxID=38358 RepID=UPI00187DCE29|nr:uncharacterized protein LOC119066087 [Bradysia coprophila]
MGCANSMPLMNGDGGMVDAAKNAVNDTMHAGEEVVKDVGESLNGAAVSVKEAVVGAVKSIGNGVDDLAKDVEQKIDDKLKNTKPAESEPTDENGEPLCKIIPLKDTKTNSLEDMDELKGILNKINEEQVPSTVETATKAADSVVESVQSKLVEDVDEMNLNEKTPTHSLDSLKTSTPEPEIINAMLNDTSRTAPSPKPTLTEMKSIEAMDDVLDVIRTVDVETEKL